MAEEDLTSKNYVWVPDSDELFVRGSITEYLANGAVQVSIKSGVQEITKEIDHKLLESCNPTKFNKCNDMAELTHLNEPSVIYNLFLRYNDDLIYTYLGLFLVAINPYKKLPIYENQSLKKFHGLILKTDERLPPHIFAIAENSHRNLVANHKDQSILVTGESGAGKTENTKKIIQYLSQISASDEHVTHTEMKDDIHEKILRANPILESFGNAKTIKNNNSSRFGKFIKIYFDSRGFISGATIDYYLLEKSRVSHQLKSERNYHVFYQMLQGETIETLHSKYSLLNDYLEYKYLSSSAGSIPQIDDANEFRHLNESFRVMGFLDEEVESIFSGLAVILHLGNIDFISWKSDQASFAKNTRMDIISSLLGLDQDELSQNLLKPKVKAGREYMLKLQNASEVKSTIDAFAKHLYEKLFQFIITRIDASLMADDVSDDHFIGVLDIAGFEIFEMNSFEQLCINYTNEKLQQFFNHHSFILEQSEYLREDIQWEYIDFGLDLQPTIDLIETKNPMGVLEILNEQCVLPKASEDTFMDKLLETWGKGDTKQFRPNRARSGFIIDHYAGIVEYNIEDWLEKNKDPVSENVLNLMPRSTNNFFKILFESSIERDASVKSKGKSLKSKTVTQKHKEQLSNLMEQLGRTEPHFVRCILPNLEKKSNKFDKELVLHQLRCNGVLEGIRIARAGFPNKMTFREFFERYSILCIDAVFTKNLKANCELVLKEINLDAELFKIGITKLFFKNGILGQLEELRDMRIKQHLTNFQSIARGQLARTKIQKQIAIIQASQVVARNFQEIDALVNDSGSPWLKLFIRLKPLLEDSVKVLDSREMNESLKKINAKLRDTEATKSTLEAENASLKEKIDALNKEILESTNAAAEKVEKLKLLEREEKSRNLKLDDTSRQLSELQAVSATLAKDKLELNDQIKTLRKLIGDLEDQVSNLKRERDCEYESVKKLEAEAKEHNSALTEYQKSMSVIKTLEQKCRSNNELAKNLESKNAELQKHNEDLKKTCLLSEANSAKIAELEGLLQTVTTEREKLMEALSEQEQAFKKKNQLLEKENNDLRSEISHVSDEKLTAQMSLATESQKFKENNTAFLIQKEEQIGDLIDQLKSATERVNNLELHCHEKQKSLESEVSSKKQLESERAELSKRMKENVDTVTTLTQQNEKNLQIIQQLQASKDELSYQLETHKATLGNFEELKDEMKLLTKINNEFSDEINSLRLHIDELQRKLEAAENSSSEQSIIDPEMIKEYVGLKAKLNEQSAVVRNERFENQKLLEEVRMLRQKVSDCFESPLKRSEARRSLAIGDENRLSQMSKSRDASELKELKILLKQEEANALRAENYAIELQRKLNRLQATRGIDTFTDYESKFRDAQGRVEELEKKIVSIISESLDYSPDDVRQAMSRSNSLGSIHPQSSLDFGKIYNDINLTLKSTRGELSKSKSEILRLKSLLRESEDEIYEMKRSNLKTSVREYEEQMAKLKIDNHTINKKHDEVKQSLQKYQSRSEEYYEKLELAESAVQISKRHENIARRELQEKNNELKLLKEEIKASGRVIKKLRQDNNEVEMKLRDEVNVSLRLQKQIEVLQQKVRYLDDTYGERKNAIELHKEEIKSLREDVKFKLEKETEIIKENKRLKIDNEELSRIRDEVLSENKEVTEENELLVQLNNAIKTELLQLLNEKHSHERKLEQSNKQVESLRRLIEENGRQLEALSFSKQKLEEENISLQENVAKLTQLFETASQDLQLLQVHAGSLDDDKRQTQQELKDLREKWDKNDESYKQARTENLVIVQENESLKTVNLELRTKIGDLETKLYSNEQLRYLETSVGRLNEEIDDLRQQLSDGDLREQALQKQISTLKYDQENKVTQLKKYNDENFNFQNMIGQYKGKMEFLFQENNEKDLKIKAQERELALLKEKYLIFENERRIGGK